jgi:hypothetical protein
MARISRAKGVTNLAASKDALRLTARSFPRALGWAEACRRDHLSDLDGRQFVAAHSLRQTEGRQAGRSGAAGSLASLVRRNAVFYMTRLEQPATGRSRREADIPEPGGRGRVWAKTDVTRDRLGDLGAWLSCGHRPKRRKARGLKLSRGLAHRWLLIESRNRSNLRRSSKRNATHSA